MNTNELKTKIQELLNENPNRKAGAAKAAESDDFNCYTWDDYSDVIKDYCYTQVNFYKVVATGDAERIVDFIQGEVENLINFYIKKVEWADDWT